jgi:large repetitive protein
VANAASASRVDLSWTDKATNESAYTVERSLDGNTGWTVLTSTLPADSTTYSDTNLNANTTYHYRVKATNQAGSSNYSNVASATPSAAVYAFSDDWTGADGAAWNRSQWTADGGSSATLDVRSNEGRMRFENASGARARAIATMPQAANTEVLMSFRFPSTVARGYLEIFCRASGNWVSGYPNSGYFVVITNSGSNVGLRKISSGTVTELTNDSVGQATTTKQWVRFRVEGSTLQAKVWTDGTPEPSGWETVATDPSVTTPGVLQLKWIRSSTATDAREVYLDDLTVRDVGP